MAPEEGRDGHAPGADAAEAASPTFLVSNDSPMVMCSLQPSLVSPAPKPSPPPPLLQEAFLGSDLPFGAYHCLPFVLQFLSLSYLPSWTVGCLRTGSMYVSRLIFSA